MVPKWRFGDPARTHAHQEKFALRSLFSARSWRIPIQIRFGWCPNRGLETLPEHMRPKNKVCATIAMFLLDPGGSQLRADLDVNAIRDLQGTHAGPRIRFVAALGLNDGSCKFQHPSHSQHHHVWICMSATGAMTHPSRSPPTRNCKWTLFFFFKIIEMERKRKAPT